MNGHAVDGQVGVARPNAPIALFCFNRPQHLERTLASLMACPEFAASPLVVYADGPRDASDLPLVEAVRGVLARLLPPSAKVIARPANVGLAANIIEGVTALCQAHGRVIVLEDDLTLDPRFLRFMNDALQRYEAVPHVYQVAGYITDAPTLSGSREAVFLPWGTSWGWATWQRAWSRFDSDATGWESLAGDAAMRRRFNLDGAYDYASMLENQMLGRRHSWAIRWYWTMFKAGALAVFPPFTLVDNTGFDGTGTHGRGWLRSFGSPRVTRVSTGSVALPDAAVVDEQVRTAVRDALWRRNGGWLGQVIDRARRAIGPLRAGARR